MNFTHQTILGEDNGNCFAACLASLLEIPIEDIPKPPPNEIGEVGWHLVYDKWLHTKGYWLLTVTNAKEVQAGVPTTIEWYLERAGECIVVGYAPHKKWCHAVVYNGSKMVHDPAPNGTGLASADSIMVLVPLQYKPHSTA